MSTLTLGTIKILITAFSTAIISIIIAHYLINFLYKIQFWKKAARTKAIDGSSAEVFASLHKEKEVGTPRGGGVMIWLSIIIFIVIVEILSFLNVPYFSNLSLLSREQTWIPLFALLSASIIGLVDDILVVYGKGKYVGGGIGFKTRLFLVSLIGLIGGSWFYFKLGWSTVNIPLIFNFPHGIDINLGLGYIVLFIVVCLASWASGVIDGLDGLAGGVFASVFGAFAIIAFAQGLTVLAAFCTAIVGCLFSFLWFNIPPARFYMGETGVLGLSMTMATVAFITDSVAVLPIIGGVFVIETGSVIIQLLSKKFRGKKIWQSTPLHHHLEAIGQKPWQITMRFWLISIVLAILGVAIKLLT